MRQPIPFGKYLLLERISVGGMAEVFKAKAFGAEGFEKILAVKRILPSMSEDADFIQMFIDEAKICGQLGHTNICQIYELGRVSDAHFIAMEFVWGKDLLQVQNRLRKQRRTMSPVMAAFIAAQLCEGLDFAHRKKDANGRPLLIIHRDVSPQNVLVSYEGEVKIIDFGIAKAVSRSARTQAGVLKGKFGYMSPEQVRGLPLDRRSDVFAIGTILYEMLTCERLFVGESDFETLERVRNVDVRSPRTVNPGIPEALERIILRALAKDVETRYQWASEMFDDLQAFLSAVDPPYTAKQLSAWMREGFRPEIERESRLLDEQRRVGREVLERLEREHPRAPSFSDPDIVMEVTPMPPMGTSVLDTSDLLELREPSGLHAIEDGADDESADQKTTVAVTGETALPGPGARPGEVRRVGPQPPVAVPRPAASAAETLALQDGPGPNDAARALASQSTLLLGDASELGPAVRSSPAASTMFAGGPSSPAPGSPGGPLPPPDFAVPIPAPDFAAPIPAPDFASPATGQTGLSGAGTHSFRRKTLIKDVMLGVAVAAVLVAAGLGLRSLVVRKPARGTMVITLRQPAAIEVFVDGASRGRFPAGAHVKVKDVPAGSRTVQLRSEDGMESSHRVEIGANDVTVLAGDLRAAGGGLGRLALEMPAGGPVQVYIDGAALPEGAWKEPIALRPGVAHEVRVTRAGARDFTTAVTVAEGEEARRKVELLPPAGSLEITTEPVGAEVAINGRRVGVSPVVVRDLDPARAARVAVRLKGYASQTQSVTFDKQLDQKLELRLAAAAISSPGRPRPAEDEFQMVGDAPAYDRKDKGGDKPAAGDKKPAPGAAEEDDLAAVKTGAGDRGSDEVGYLVANTQPWAKVIIDGKDTGKTTPIAPRSKIPLKPGKHVVTFVAGGKKFTYDVTIKSSQDTWLVKTLLDDAASP